MQFLNSIRNKLLLAYAVVTLPPMIALGWYGGDRIEAALRIQGLQRLENRISVLSAQIEGFLTGTDGDLLLLADTPALTQYLLALDSNDPVLIEAAGKNLSQAFVRLSEVRGNYFQIRYIDALGKEKIRVVRTDGRTSVISADRLSDKATADIEKALKLPKGQVVVSPLGLNRESGVIQTPHRAVIRYSAPVFDAIGRRRGALVISVAADPIIERVGAAARDGEVLFFVDPEGNYLSHPDESKRWGGTDQLGTGEGLKKDLPDMATQILETADLFRDENETLLTLAKPVAVPGAEGVYLGVLVDRMPTELLFATASSFRSFFNILTVGALFLALVFGSIVAYYVTQPIVQLTQAVDRLSRGDLEQSIEVSSNDETQKLAASMERLRVSMKLMLDKLE